MPHDIFDFFKRYSSESSKILADDRKRFQLISVKDRILYVWTSVGLRAAVGLKYVSSSSSNSETNKFRACTYEKEVEICLSISPVEQVNAIEVNTVGSCLAIIGENAIHVVYLPRTFWTFKSLAEIDSQYLCDCISVGRDVFSKTRSVKCLRARWHPGSSEQRHLVTLWNDDCIRIYHLLSSADTAIQTLRTTHLDDSGISPKSRVVRTSIGEAPVSFDFGAPAELSENSNAVVWPIFVLFGNGDVCCVQSDIKHYRQYPVIGPLLMSPPVENNYGVDSCDITFLQGKVPLLVIATSFGILYHAVVIRNKEVSGLSFSLHVYESVELEFSLSTVDLATSEIKEDNVSSAIYLLKDSIASRRYYAYHSTGIHAIALPWLKDLEENNCQMLSDKPSAVEYMLCFAPRKVVDGNQKCPIGLALVNSLYGSATLLALSSDYSIYCLPINYASLTLNVGIHYDETSASAASTTDDQDMAGTKKIQREYFIDTIKRIIQRNNNLPLLKGNKKAVTDEETAELLSRCIQVLRTEYCDRILLARDTCDKRVQELSKIFSAQTESFDRLNASVNAAQTWASRTAETKQELVKRQENLCTRLERVAAVVNGETGALSAAEDSMLKEMKDMQNSVVVASTRVAQLREKVNALCRNDRDGNERILTTATISSLHKRLDDQHRQIESVSRSVKFFKQDLI